MAGQARFLGRMWGKTVCWQAVHVLNMFSTQNDFLVSFLHFWSGTCGNQHLYSTRMKIVFLSLKKKAQI